jgi:hypothetical protein
MSPLLARATLASAIVQFHDYKVLGEQAMVQCHDEELTRTIAAESNSIAVIVKHLHGNMRSRWRDFLTTDGEKADRHRDEEFVECNVSRDEILAWWDHGWTVCLTALNALTPDDLGDTVTIRGKPMLVIEAVHRQLAHYSYHVGQIVLLAKTFRDGEWRSLSIPRGQSEAYNQSPGRR